MFEVSLTNKLFPLYVKKESESIVVIIDIFRATSTICTAFGNGIDEIKVVKSIEEAKKYDTKEYLITAERDGNAIEGIEYSNSPIELLKDLRGKKMVITTTNGTKAIELAKKCNKVIIGSYLNINKVIEYLKETKLSIILACSGRKDKLNFEDCFYAGEIISELIKKGKLKEENFTDEMLIVYLLYKKHESLDRLETFTNSNTGKRIIKKGKLEDLKFCIQKNKYDVLPIYKNGKLVNES